MKMSKNMGNANFASSNSILARIALKTRIIDTAITIPDITIAATPTVAKYYLVSDWDSELLSDIDDYLMSELDYQIV
jgi:hypothetical protein